MRVLFLISLSIIIVFSSCSKDDDNNSITCDTLIILDRDLYDSVNTQNYTILSAVITNDCLEVEIYSGGCDGNTLEVNLIDAEIIAESNPIQRFIKVSLKNEELCLAMIANKYSFDLKPIRTTDSRIMINLENWNGSLLYNY